MRKKLKPPKITEKDEFAICIMHTQHPIYKNNYIFRIWHVYNYIITTKPFDTNYYYFVWYLTSFGDRSYQYTKWPSFLYWIYLTPQEFNEIFVKYNSELHDKNFISYYRRQYLDTKKIKTWPLIPRYST